MKTASLILSAMVISLTACSAPKEAPDESGSAGQSTQDEGSTSAVESSAGRAQEMPAGSRLKSDEPMHDANGNGIEDAIDITDGTSEDLNGNGIPDDGE